MSNACADGGGGRWQFWAVVAAVSGGGGHGDAPVAAHLVDLDCSELLLPLGLRLPVDCVHAVRESGDSLGRLRVIHLLLLNVISYLRDVRPVSLCARLLCLLTLVFHILGRRLSSLHRRRRRPGLRLLRSSTALLVVLLLLGRHDHARTCSLELLRAAARSARSTGVLGEAIPADADGPRASLYPGDDAQGTMPTKLREAGFTAWPNLIKLLEPILHATGLVGHLEA